MDTRSRRSRSGLTAGTRSFSGRARCLRGPRSDPAKPVKTTGTRPRTTVRSEARPLRALRFQGACLALPSASGAPAYIAELRTHQAVVRQAPFSRDAGCPIDPSVSVTIVGTRAKSVPQPINSYHRNEFIGGSCDRERRGAELGSSGAVLRTLGLDGTLRRGARAGLSLFGAGSSGRRTDTLD